MKALLAGLVLLASATAAPVVGLAAVGSVAAAPGRACPPGTSGPGCPEDPSEATPLLPNPVGVSPRTAAAVRTAAGLVGATGGWYRKCDKLACRMYGYYNSGYLTATIHWYTLLRAGHAHPGHRCPPVGAFLFWATGSVAGHVAFVAATDPTCRPERITLVTNDYGDTRTGNVGGVYAVSLAQIEDGWMSRANYRGWTDPICAGTPLAAR